MQASLRQTCSQRGFTLLELMVALTIIAVVAVTVMPQFRNEDRLRVIAAAQILTSDIEAAQVMTISYPEQPVVVRFDTAAGQYWLAESATPDTPILHQPTGVEYLVEFGVGRAAAANGVTITVSNTTDDTIEFDSNGGLMDFTSAPAIRLQRGEAIIELIIAPTTGSVIETTVEFVEGGGSMEAQEGIVPGGGLGGGGL